MIPPSVHYYNRVIACYSFFTPSGQDISNNGPVQSRAADAALERQDEDCRHDEGDGQELERSDAQRDGPLEDAVGYSADPPSIISTAMISTAKLQLMTASLMKDRMFRPL